MASFVAVLLLVSISTADAELHVTRLRPDASFAVAANEPVTFTFAPTSDERAQAMQAFRVWVQSDSTGKLVADSGKVNGSEPRVQMPLSPGRYRWSVQWWSKAGGVSPVATSDVVVAVANNAWEGVAWLGGTRVNEFYIDFKHIAAPGAKVDLLFAALGFGHATVNGQAVSSDMLSPSGWTNTEKRVLFRTYDITPLLNTSEGRQRLMISLGCGYRCDEQNRFPAYQNEVNKAAQKTYDSIPKIFRLQVRVNGACVVHSGSEGWMQRQGPVVRDSVYGGEIYAPHKVGAWSKAVALPAGHGPRGEMVAAAFPGVRVLRTDEPVSITNPASDVFVVDFGSNTAGVCEISIPSAANVSLKHGELKQHAGLPYLRHVDTNRVYFDNLRSAQAQDTLVLKDGGVEKWSPKFTYHGFRYVEIYGYPGILNASSIRRLVMTTALETRTRANFSDEVLQQIHLGSVGTQRWNLMSVPTDCPQRDERLAWLGDLSLSAASMATHFHFDSMASDYVDSMVSELGPDGSLTDVVPAQRFGSRPADISWNAALISTLFALWEAGNIAPAEKHWDAIKANIAFLQAQLDKAGSIHKLPEKYGDWCPPPQKVGTGQGAKPSHGFSAAFSLILSIKQAANLGKQIGGHAAQDAMEYATLAQNLTTEFHKAYFKRSTNTYDNGEMISYVLPLALNATPSSQRDSVVSGLLKYIHNNSDTWWGGIINNRFLFDVLHDSGHGDVAVKMLQKREYPSYGFMYFNDLEPARECMWELPDAPYEGTGMNSRNHHMYSSVGKYLVDRIGGLSMSRNAEVIAYAGAYNGHARVSIDGEHGTATFAWSHGSHTEVEVEVPVGMVGHVHVPTSTGGVHLLGHGLLVADEALPEGVLSIGDVMQGAQGFHRIDVSSGRYKFTTHVSSASREHTLPVVIV